MGQPKLSYVMSHLILTNNLYNDETKINYKIAWVLQIDINLTPSTKRIKKNEF